MAAILRVKRRNEDEPLGALVIACKRRKTEETVEADEHDVSTPVKTVLKFAGTVKNQEDNVVEQLVKTLRKEELKSSFKQHTVDVLNKAREQAKHMSMENRYKVINCLRSLDTSNIEEFEDKIMTLIDVEDSVSCNVIKDSSVSKDDNYVYDLYYAQTEDSMYIDDMVSVHALDQELVYDTYRDNCYPNNECESEDSNSESNWRNDYPDSDHSQKSIDDEDMREAVMNMRLEEGSDLSSDDDFVYAVDEKDVDDYGYKYARYKARIKEELEEGDSDLSEYSGICITEEPDDDNESHKSSD